MWLLGEDLPINNLYPLWPPSMMLCIKDKIEAERLWWVFFGVRKSAFRTPESIRKSPWGQNSLFRTRNKIISDMNRIAATHVNV